jgi:AcrR family transcriptional regulator
MAKNDYHHGNLKEELLKVALDVIATQNIEKLTLKVLADTTGTARTAIYKHFKSKDALMEKVIETGFEKFDESVSPILTDKNKPLIDRFYLAAKHYIEFARNNPNLYRLLFGEKYASLRESIISIKDENCSGFAAFKRAIEEGQESGILRKDDSFQRTIILWSMLHGLSSLLIDGFMDVDKIYEELFEKMFQDMLAITVAGKVKLLSNLPFADSLLKPNA